MESSGRFHTLDMSSPIKPYQGQLDGLRYALALVEGRRVLRRHPAYLAAIDDLELFLKASIERVENGETMHSEATTQTAP